MIVLLKYVVICCTGTSSWSVLLDWEFSQFSLTKKKIKSERDPQGEHSGPDQMIPLLLLPVWSGDRVWLTDVGRWGGMRVRVLACVCQLSSGVIYSAAGMRDLESEWRCLSPEFRFPAKMFSQWDKSSVTVVRSWCRPTFPPWSCLDWALIVCVYGLLLCFWVAWRSENFMRKLVIAKSPGLMASLWSFMFVILLISEKSRTVLTIY